jgi:Helix-turn-helix domain
VTRKYSLKDNPIFQGLKAPIPRETDPTLEETLTDGGQNLTLKTRPSKIDIQEISLDEQIEQPDLSPAEQTAASEDAPPRAVKDNFALQDHIDKSLFFGFYNEVADVLLPTLEPTAQVLYNRLFRLSYGFNRNYCTVSQALLMERTGLSRNTVRTGLQSLLRSGWISIVESGNRVSTTYRVILPREREENENIRGSIFEGQNLTLKRRGAAADPVEGQNSALQKMSGNGKKERNAQENNPLQSRLSKFDPQDLPPLLSFTNRSLTLSERASEDQNLTRKNLLLSARELVDKFYALLGQRVPKAKREQSMQECLALLQEGFTPEEVDYAMSWLVTRHPETGAFSRVPYFIDQALKEQQMIEHATASQQQQRVAEAQQRQAEQQLKAEQQQLDDIFASLPAAEQQYLQQHAAVLVAQEHGEVSYGHATLIRFKVEELIRERYLMT